MINLFLQSRGWFLQSISLIRQSLKISIFFGMLYLAMYMILPAIPGMQFMGLFSIFIWPFLTILIVCYYKALAEKKLFLFEQCVEMIKPKIISVLLVGLFSFFYAILLSSLLGNDIASLVEISQENKEYQFTVGDFSGIFSKLIVLAIPFMMMTWFSPLLITFKNYSFIKSIKSSFAASLMYLFQIALALIGIIFLFLILVFAVSMTLSLFGGTKSTLISFLLSFSTVILMAIFIASTFALQSITFKAIFK